MRKRGQIIKLKNIETSKVVEAKVVLADSKQGYLAEERGKARSFLDAWRWYSPKEWEEL